MGAHWVGIKTKKNLVLEQIVAKSNFLLQLSWWRLFSFFLSFCFFPQMAFQLSLEVKIRSRVTGPSQILLIAAGLSSRTTLTPRIKTCLGISLFSTLPWISLNSSVLIVFCSFFFQFFCLCTTLPWMPRDYCISATLKLSAFLLDVGHFKASVHKIKAVLMWSSCSNIDANFFRLLCLQTVESLF